MSTPIFVPHFKTLRRLVLWRHGQTDWNRTGRAQGHADVGLDDVGRLQAQRAAKELAAYEPVFIWSSDLARAWQTAGELAALVERDVVLDERLREFDVGARQGLTIDEFAEQNPQWWARLRAGERLAIPGAETTDQVVTRMRAVLADAAAGLGDGETGVLVGHGAALRTGVLAFFAVTDEHPEMLAGMSNCAWTVLEERAGRGWQIIDYNAQTLPPSFDLADEGPVG